MTKLREMNIVDPTDDSKKLAVASDGTINTKISDGTNTATITGNKLDVNASLSWNNSNKVKVTDGTDDLAVNSDGSINISDNGSSLTIDATSLPLPTGAATSALQTQPGVDIGDVTVNNASGAAAVNIQDGGNSLTVDQATGTNLHVVTDSQIPGTGATNLGKAEDAAHTSGDTGVMALAVRNDAATALAGTTGDYIPLGTDEFGNLRVNISRIMPGQTDLWQQRCYDGQGFHLTTGVITISGTSETPFLLLRNPNASGKTVRINKIAFGLVASVTGDSHIWRIYRDATVTGNGTAKTPTKIKKSQSASAVLLAGTAPTVSANGTNMLTGASTSAGSYNILLENLSLYIEQNENLYFTIQSALTGKGHYITIWFEEE